MRFKKHDFMLVPALAGLMTATSAASAEDFSGFHVALGLTGGAPFQLSQPPLSYDRFFDGSVAGFLGYDFQSTDGFVFGVSSAFSADFTPNVIGYAEYHDSRSLPVLVGNQQGHPGPSFPTSGVIPGPEWYAGALVEHTITTHSINFLDGIASGRVGYANGDTLVFGRVGAGISKVSLTTHQDTTGTILCRAYSTEWHMPPDGMETWATACLDPYSPTPVSHHVDTYVGPTIQLGLGVEQSLGSAFVRAEADMKHTFLGPSSRDFGDLTRFNVTAAVGFRL